MKLIRDSIRCTAVFVLGLSMLSCQDNFILPIVEQHRTVRTRRPPNLIQNSSFEVNDQPSLQSWFATYAYISQDAPPQGGTWSLLLYPSIPEQWAITFVTGQSGIGVYRLTVWVKSINGWAGTVMLGHWAQNRFVQSTWTGSDSTQWNAVSVIDTLSLQPSDTIAVRLSANGEETSNGFVLFDLVDLERIPQPFGTHRR